MELGTTTLLQLAGRSVDPLEIEDDQFGRLDPSNRVFTVKSTYHLLRGGNRGESWKGWRRIWRLRVQERIKVFMWLLAHDKILTNGLGGVEI